MLASAALFGTLGPLSRFAYDAGMEPPAFVAWRALIGVSAPLAFVAWRAPARRVAWSASGALSPRARVTLLVAALMGFTLNLVHVHRLRPDHGRAGAAGLLHVPAMVAVVNVALGRERLDRRA